MMKSSTNKISKAISRNIESAYIALDLVQFLFKLSEHRQLFSDLEDEIWSVMADNFCSECEKEIDDCRCRSRDYDGYDDSYYDSWRDEQSFLSDSD